MRNRQHLLTNQITVLKLQLPKVYLYIYITVFTVQDPPEVVEGVRQDVTGYIISVDSTRLSQLQITTLVSTSTACQNGSCSFSYSVSSSDVMFLHGINGSVAAENIFGLGGKCKLTTPTLSMLHFCSKFESEHACMACTEPLQYMLHYYDMTPICILTKLLSFTSDPKLFNLIEDGTRIIVQCIDSELSLGNIQQSSFVCDFCLLQCNNFAISKCINVNSSKTSLALKEGTYCYRVSILINEETVAAIRDTFELKVGKYWCLHEQS